LSQQIASLRERNKARTREALVEAAFGLFEAKGYDHTTVDDIAAAADVSPRTFFRYFATKDDVIFGQFPDVTAELLATLEARPADEAAITSLRHAARVVAARELENPDATRLILRLVAETPSLGDTYVRLLSHLDAAIVDWAAKRLGTSADDLRPRLLAAAAMAARRAAVDTWLENGAVGDLQALLDDALDLLAGGLEKL
jgi:AcrR family transcriptional regulator